MLVYCLMMGNLLYTTSIRLSMEVQICLSVWTYINYWHVSYSVTCLYTAVTEFCVAVN